MAAKPVLTLFNAVAVSGTTTYKSEILKPGRGSPQEFLAQFEFTSTAAGTLSLEINNDHANDYAIAVAAAGSEAANTTRWQQRDLSPTTTIAITAGATVNVTFKGRALRMRFSYVNASGSGVLSGRVALP